MMFEHKKLRERFWRGEINLDEFNQLLRNCFKTLRTVFRCAKKACAEEFLRSERVFKDKNRRFLSSKTRSLR
jgi:hypothetical protein